MMSEKIIMEASCLILRNFCKFARLKNYPANRSALRAFASGAHAVATQLTPP
jgi:hypothetical protein